MPAPAVSGKSPWSPTAATCDQDDVCEALLAHASTIRVSLYDWEEEVFSGSDSVFQRLQALRRRIDADASPLRIGVSALTSTARLGRLRRLVQAAATAGVHWLYFHPRCHHWDQGRPQPEEQSGVLDEIARLREEFSAAARDRGFQPALPGFPPAFRRLPRRPFHAGRGRRPQKLPGRRGQVPPRFRRSPTWAGTSARVFSGEPARLQRIAAQNSANYRALGSRHRGVLYNDFIERLKRHDPGAERILAAPPAFRFPHIL